MLTRPFLTELDSRAAVKGSVDPLGIQAVWVSLGREVVGNLTTVSTSVRDFTILLAGYYLAQRVVERSRNTTEVEAFLRWEQLAAYVRAHALKDESFRGVTRTKARLDEGLAVTLNAQPAFQILANQRSYGIFGLYSQPARASGWVERERVALTPAATQLVERHMLPVLATGAGREAGDLIRWLSEPSKRIDLGKQSALTKAVAELLRVTSKDAVRDAYRQHLLHGGPGDTTLGRQKAFASLLESLDKSASAPMDRDLLKTWMKSARRASFAASGLEERLNDIWVCESVMAPAIALFAFISQCDGGSIESAARDVRETWGTTVASVQLDAFRALLTRIPRAYSDDVAPRYLEIAGSLAQGNYSHAIRSLITQNARVMQARGGSAWLEERRGKLHVNLRYDEAALPRVGHLPGLWRHAYFLDACRQLGAQLVQG